MTTTLRRFATLGLWDEVVTLYEQHPDAGERGRAIYALALAANRMSGPADYQISQLMADPDLPSDAAADVAATLLLLGRAEAAQDLLQSVLANDPQHALANLRYGAWQLTQGDLAAALPMLELGLAAYPDHIASRAALVAALLDAVEKGGDAVLAQHHIQQLANSLSQLGGEIPQVALDASIARVREQQLDLWAITEQRAAAEEWLTEQAAKLAPDDVAQLVLAYTRRVAARMRMEEALAFLVETIDSGRVEAIALLVEAAESSMALGRTREAVNFANRSIKLATVQGKLTAAHWARKAAFQSQAMPQKARHDLKRAKALLDTALIAPETEAEARAMKPFIDLTEAQILMEEGAFPEVEALVLEILSGAPEFGGAWGLLGQVRTVRGNIEGAVEAFERLAQIDPMRGHNALIHANRFPEDPALLDRLEQMVRSPNLPPQLRANFLMSLASAWDKARDYDRAFGLVSEGNRIIRNSIRYDAQDHRAQCARIRARFSAAFMQDRAGYGNPSEVPVFVVGMPRSGTTLVEQILSGHSAVHGAGELGHIPQLTQGMNRWERRIGSGRSYPDCTDDLTKPEVQAMAARVLAKLETMGDGAARVVDKLPHNFMNIGLIKLLFPKARIISVRRDPRDIAISNYFIDFQARHGGMGFAYDLGDIGTELADHAQLMWHWNMVFPGQILEVQYEALVDDFEGQSRRIIDYLALDWEPQVLSFNELDRPVRTASVMQVRKPIYASSKAKWRRYQKYLAPLAEAANRPIPPLSVPDMVHVKQPGLLAEASRLLTDGDLDQAERLCRIILAALPGHAAAGFLLGVIHARKGHPGIGLDLIEKALVTCPQRRDWRQEALQICAVTKDADRAARFDPKGHLRRAMAKSAPREETA